MPAATFAISDAQRASIYQPRGRILLIGGPGSGKTTTLALRVHHVFENDPPLTNLHVLTRTTAARDAILNAGRNLWTSPLGSRIKSFSDLGLAMLRSDPFVYLRSPGFAVLTATRQIEVGLRALEMVGLRCDIGAFLELIDDAKYSLHHPGDPALHTEVLQRWFGEPRFGLNQQSFVDAASSYERLLWRMNAVDAADLVSLPALMLRKTSGNIPISPTHHLFIDDVHALSSAEAAMVKAMTPCRSVFYTADSSGSTPTGGGMRYLDTLLADPSVSKHVTAVSSRPWSYTASRIRGLERRSLSGVPNLTPSFASIADHIGWWDHSDSSSFTQTMGGLLREDIERGTPPHLIAIAYRTSAIEPMVVAALSSLSVPFNRPTSTEGNADPRIQAAIGLVRLIRNPRDADAVLLLRPVIPDDLQSSIETICNYATRNGMTLVEAAVEISPEHASFLEDFERSINELRRTGVQDIGQISQLAGVLEDLAESISTHLNIRLPETFDDPLWDLIIPRAMTTATHPSVVTGKICLRRMDQLEAMVISTLHIVGFSTNLVPLIGRDPLVERALAYSALGRSQHATHLHHIRELELQFPGTRPLLPSPLLLDLGFDVPELAADRQLEIGPKLTFRPS